MIAPVPVLPRGCVVVKLIEAANVRQLLRRLLDRSHLQSPTTSGLLPSGPARQQSKCRTLLKGVFVCFHIMCQAEPLTYVLHTYISVLHHCIAPLAEECQCWRLLWPGLWMQAPSSTTDLHGAPNQMGGYNVDSRPDLQNTSLNSQMADECWHWTPLFTCSSLLRTFGCADCRCL